MSPPPGPDGRGPAPVSPPEPVGGPGERVRRRIPQVLALAVVWVLLWGHLNPPTILGGLLVGLVVTVLFPLPLLPEPTPVRPVKLLRLVGFLLVDLVVSGVRVSVVAVRHGRRASSGIIGLPLFAESDRTATAIAVVCALSPGSFALQIDRGRDRWYVYVLGLHRPGAVDRARRDMMTLQLRVVEAIGSETDVRGCRAAADDPAAGGPRRPEPEGER